MFGEGIIPQVHHLEKQKPWRRTVHAERFKAARSATARRSPLATRVTPLPSAAWRLRGPRLRRAAAARRGAATLRFSLSCSTGAARTRRAAPEGEEAPDGVDFGELILS
eukprot:5854013-Pleurochrysis_carterae.AAC.1